MVGASEVERRGKMPLTDIAIRNAKPKSKPYKLGDSQGLFLLVTPSGGKLWRVKPTRPGRSRMRRRMAACDRSSRSGRAEWSALSERIEI